MASICDLGKTVVGAVLAGRRAIAFRRAKFKILEIQGATLKGPSKKEESRAEGKRKG